VSDEHDAFDRPRLDIGDDRVDDVAERELGDVSRSRTATGEIDRECRRGQERFDAGPDPSTEHGAMEQDQPSSSLLGCAASDRAISAPRLKRISA
jgi:hypothetical protein